MKYASLSLAAATLCLAGCGAGEPDVALAERTPDLQVDSPQVAPPASAPVCSIAEAGQPLPEEVHESSGLAQSRRDPDLFWTHNDAGNDPELFAVDSEGRLVQRVSVAGAELVDWEDIESGPCDAGNCLYVGDTGDNDGERERISIYRVPEPEAGASEAQPEAILHARYPDGRHDSESLFVLPSGEIYLVTKGRRGPIVLYRYPLPQRPGETVTMERVGELFPEPEIEDDRVTAATASPDGRWVGIRTYHTLYLYPAADLTGGGTAEPTVVNLEPLGQPKGESVVISADGAVWLTSEAEGDEGRPRLSRLQCSFSEGWEVTG